MAPRTALLLFSTLMKRPHRMPAGRRTNRDMAELQATSDLSVRHYISQYFLELDAHILSRVVLKPGLITQANGSAYIETEHTKLACAMLVYLR
jgi:hypothetical protein